MTTFCGIQIQGIRSFHPDSPELIELNPPLTVIVGHNGAGKTTIVECLRYVTTGKLPGGTFVHDPRFSPLGLSNAENQLLQRSEVKAQVRLLFKDEKDNKYLCCRSLSGTATGKGKGTSTISQKSVDGVFAIHNAENVQRSVTMKCSDLDLKVRMLLGVPKTILESVIFCIQEDSNWPLADPATLKKRFDEIFGLDGWKATLDTFNVPEKKLLERQKVTHTQLQYLRTENDMAEQTKQRLQEYQAEESRCEQVSADLDQRIEQVETQIATLENIRDTLKEKEHDKTMLEKSVSSLREHINVLQASDEELNMEFIRYNEEIDKRELRREELRADVERIRNEKQSYENQIMEMERQITRHSMNIENHKQKIAELEQAFNDEAHPLRDTVQIFADTFKSPTRISQQKGELVKRKNQIEVFFKQLKAEAHQ
ncbi:6166_t:CDS:2, partial [Paraglomus occultum]